MAMTGREWSMAIMRICGKLVPQKYRTLYRFIREDPSRNEDLPLRTKIGMWRRGFHANRYYYYDLKNNDCCQYVSDLYNLLTYPKNGLYSALIDNKMYLPVYLHRFADHLPDYYFLIGSGHVFRLYGDRTVVPADSPEFRDAFFSLVQNRPCIGKPVGKSCGEGVIVFEYRAGAFYVNNKPYSSEDLWSLVKTQRNYLICERIEQHPYSVALSPNTTNTIRLLTCWDPATNQPFIARGFHRIGRPTMYGADNGALGGLITAIDVEKGTLGRIAYISKGRVEYRNEHPDSGVPVSGTVIPRFASVASTVIRMCYELNYVPYIAWDIVVTDDSFKVLELNSNTDMYGYQLFEPLLSDSRLLAFYRKLLTRKNQSYFMRPGSFAR